MLYKILRYVLGIAFAIGIIISVLSCYVNILPLNIAVVVLVISLAGCIVVVFMERS